MPPIEPMASPLDETCANALAGPFEMAIPAPEDVQAEGDDGSVRLTWDGSLGRSWEEFHESIEGYRVCWGPSEEELQHAVLFTERAGTLFGVTNGVPYVAVVQAVDRYGRVSPPSEVVTITGDASRVDALAVEMTGFFDDFNRAEGAVDELRWNVAFSQCNDPTASHTYVGPQQHALSVLSNSSQLPGSEEGCDRDQNIARPRAVFDFTGREGRITFDFDGAIGGRSTWYVDVFPYESEADLIDISGHVTFDPGGGHPGRFLRFSQSGDRLMIHQHAADGEPIHIAETTFVWDHPDQHLIPGQLMRHWELRVSRSRAAIYIDGQLLLDNPDIDLDFERSVVHWSQFTYNPIKEGVPWHMLHWDNFGFDGPATPIVTHNYKASFTRDDIVRVGWPEYEGSWSVEIPDSLEGARAARFFYTIQTHAYAWSTDDHFVLNGRRFDIPEPTSPTGTWQDGSLANAYPPFSTSIEIPLAALRTGANAFEFHAENSWLLNKHVEVYFHDPATTPEYTAPATMLESSPIPALEPIGPYARVHQIEGAFIDEDGPTVSGTVSVMAVVENHRQYVMMGQNLGIARVELLVDGVVVASVDTAESVAAPGIYDGPFEWNQPHDGGIELMLDTSALSNGEHILEARAYDSAGTVSRGWGGIPGEHDAVPIRVAN